MSQSRYIIEFPFEGEPINATFVDDNGIERLVYGDREPLSEYLNKNDSDSLMVVSYDELFEMAVDYAKSQETEPQPISQDEFYRLLEEMPPERKFRRGGWLFFLLC